jgi:leucyl-tRNA synthetase
MLRLFNQGIILGEDSEKMSKSRGNVVDPDDLVGQYGADVVRAFLMFIGPWEEGGPWNSRGIQGVVRWVNDAWDLALAAEAGAFPAAVGEGGMPTRDGADASHAPASAAAERDLRRATHRTIQKVTDGFERFGFNTAVATLMEFRNTLKAARALAGSPAWDEAVDALLCMMAPIAPHVTEELWQRRGRPYSIHQQAWPTFDPALTVEAEIEIAIQVTGKVRDRMTIPVDLPEDAVIAQALARETISKLLGGRPPRKAIYVAGRLVNIVV